MSTNVTVIAEYREAKKKVEELAAAARQQMADRFAALLDELAQLRAEFYEAFGQSLDNSVPEATPPAPPPADQKIGPKIGGLRRSLASAIKRNDSTGIASARAKLAELGVVLDPPASPDSPAVPEPMPISDDMPF
jgi:hypothetical protein